MQSFKQHIAPIFLVASLIQRNQRKKREMKRKTNTITEKHPVVVPLVGRFIHADLSIKKGQIFLVGTAKGQVEYSKLLFTTFHSRITIPVSSASNSFRTEQNSSVAKLYSSPVAPETLISLMSYDVCENIHTRSRAPASCLERSIFIQVYIFIRVTQGFRNRHGGVSKKHGP